MRKLFLELIERIYPYPVSPGALVFEVHSKNGIYNVLLDANQRGDKRISRYIKGSLAYWQQSKNRLSNYDEGRFFMVDESIISGEVTEGVKFTKLSFHRLEQLCSQHGWEINYDLW